MNWQRIWKVALISTLMAWGSAVASVPQDCLDNTVRIWRRVGNDIVFGSGSIVGETEDYYIVDSNAHVTKVTTNIFDVFNYGFHASKVQATTKRENWRFADKQSKDLSTTYIPKSRIPGPMPVIPYAPYGTDIRAGQRILIVGCADGRTPRGRVGHVTEVSNNGTFSFVSTAWEGDSGSAIYDITGTHVIGRVAWSVSRYGERMGLAMTSDRVHDIKSGRVSAGDYSLPEDAQRLQAFMALPSDARALPTLLQAQAFVDEAICENGICEPPRWRQPGEPTNEPEDQEPTPADPATRPKSDPVNWQSWAGIDET